MGILGIVTMPLGLDAEFWRQIGYGIEWMNAVGLWIASLPGAYGRISLRRKTEPSRILSDQDRTHLRTEGTPLLLRC